MTLPEFFQANPRAAVAFSGGTDSAYLLYAAARYARRVRAYCARSPFQPAFEWEDARRLAGELGVELRAVELDVLALPEVAANPADRCYHCKRAVFSAISRAAREDGFPLLIDGTNASDDAWDRPGMRALRELRVRSPLRECGLSKGEVRRLSKEAGLFTWDKPAYACLATSIPAGCPLDRDALNRVEQAEEALSALGFSDFRVRVFHGAARLQFPEAQLAEALARREEVKTAVAPWFQPVLLDLAGR